MGIVVGIIVFLITLAVVFSLIERGMASCMLRPYIGFFLIAALIAVIGVAVGALFGGAQSFFLFIAKLIVALTCSALCLHLIALIVRLGCELRIKDACINNTIRLHDATYLEHFKRSQYLYLQRYSVWHNDGDQQKYFIAFQGHYFWQAE